MLQIEPYIGTSLIVSTPPAMTTCDWPLVIWPMAVVMAWLADMQAIVSVWAGMRSVKPAASEALSWCKKIQKKKRICIHIVFVQLKTDIFYWKWKLMKNLACNICCLDFLDDGAHDHVVNVSELHVSFLH